MRTSGGVLSSMQEMEGRQLFIRSRRKQVQSFNDPLKVTWPVSREGRTCTEPSDGRTAPSGHACDQVRSVLHSVALPEGGN